MQGVTFVARWDGGLVLQVNLFCDIFNNVEEVVIRVGIKLGA